MTPLTIKIPAALEQALLLAAQREHVSKSELVRRALAAYLSRSRGPALFVSAPEPAGDLIGCFQGEPNDLASNPKHMAGFGREH